jgi:hypothetical protein
MTAVFHLSGALSLRETDSGKALDSKTRSGIFGQLAIRKVPLGPDGAEWILTRERSAHLNAIYK